MQKPGGVCDKTNFELAVTGVFLESKKSKKLLRLLRFKAHTCHSYC